MSEIEPGPYWTWLLFPIWTSLCSDLLYKPHHCCVTIVLCVIVSSYSVANSVVVDHQSELYSTLYIKLKVWELGTLDSIFLLITLLFSSVLVLVNSPTPSPSSLGNTSLSLHHCLLDHHFCYNRWPSVSFLFLSVVSGSTGFCLWTCIVLHHSGTIWNVPPYDPTSHAHWVIVLSLMYISAMVASSNPVWPLV